MTPEEVVFAFVEAINSRRVDRISELMTHDHVFIESDGEEVAGRERMRDAWAAYFKMVPDYRIQVTETLTRDNTVVLLGTATGTISHEGNLDLENRWSVPAAWRVVVEGEGVAVWQLYVDLDPVRQILERLGEV
jgi:ketosteroid isomerase-like protein